MTRWLAALVATVLALASPAWAQTASYSLKYTTFFDGVNAPVTVSATLFAAPDPFATNGRLVTTISGTRGGQAITGLSDPFSEFYYPATTLSGYSFATFLDSFGITFTAGGVDYQIYRDPSDTSFYHESQNPNGISVGRLILPTAFSITPNAVASATPEPATWVMMIGGLGLVGGALRRRRVTERMSALA